MENFLRKLLISWFIILSLLIFLPASIILINSNNKENTSVKFPTPPVTPSTFSIVMPDSKKTPEEYQNYVKLLTSKLDNYKNQVTAYGQDVTAYEKAITAYKSYYDNSKKDTLKEGYTLIINGTFLNILEKLVIAFIGFAFVKGGAYAFYAQKAAENKQEIKPFRLFD